MSTEKKKKSTGKRNPLIRFFKSFNSLRIIIVNLIFWTICILLIFAYFANRPRKAEEYSFLYWTPQSSLVLENGPVSLLAIPDYLEGYQPAPDLQTLIKALDVAADDPRILGLFADLSRFSSSAPGIIDELNRHIDQFRDKGKLYYAFSYSYNRDSWLLASGADKIICDPLGEVLIERYAAELPFYGEALENWDIDMNVFQSGDYKSAPDRYTESELQPESRKEYLRWMNRLQDRYFIEAAGRREITEAELENYISLYADLLEKSRGNGALLAQEKGLVDHIMSFQDAEDLLAGITGYSKRNENSWKEIGISEYVAHQEGTLGKMSLVATIILEGEIGTGGSNSLDPVFVADQIRSLTGRPGIEGLLLRINSPGGSAEGAEEIRRAVEDFRQSGYPVVASISGMGASGGYWIACESDYIFCEDRSITGSIGVYSIIPNLNRFLAGRLGIHYEKLTTGNGYSDFSLFSPLDSEARRIFQSRNDFFYQQFQSLVSVNRNISLDKLESLCEGRIWTGCEAVGNGLADEIGGYQASLDKIVELAVLDEFSVQFIPSRYIDYSFPTRLIQVVSFFERGFSGLLSAFP